jgi:uncharacterized membrane protein YeiH
MILVAMTASFGGIARDVMAGETPLVLHKEVYVTAALAGAGGYVSTFCINVPASVGRLTVSLTGFPLRALAIAHNWSLPAFKARGADL